MDHACLRSRSARAGRITLGSLAMLCVIVICLITGQSLSHVSTGGDGAANASGGQQPDAAAASTVPREGRESIADLFLIERDPFPDGDLRNAGRVLLRDAATGDVLRSLSGFRSLDGFGGSAVMIEHAGGVTLAVSAMWAGPGGGGRVYLYDVVETLATREPIPAPRLQIAGNIGEIYGAGLFRPTPDDLLDLFEDSGAPVDPASLEGVPLVGVYSVFAMPGGDAYLRRSVHDAVTGEAALIESDESALERGTIRIYADLDGDGVVDSADLAILLANFGRVCTGADCRTLGDLNGDGVVNAQDLAILLGNWGRRSVELPDLGDEGEWAPIGQLCCLPNGLCGPACICSGTCEDGGDPCDPSSLTPCDEDIPCTGEGCDDGGGGGDGGPPCPEPPCDDTPCPDCPDPCPDCPDKPCIGDNCDPCDDCDLNCHVVINGCNDWIAIPADGEPLIFTAGAGPSGGELSWSATGAMIDGDGPTAEVTITQPGPVSVTVSYTVKGSTCSDTCEFEAIQFTLDTEDPVVVVNRSDTDRDGIPDYADGFGLFGAETAIGTAGNRFVPLYLSVGDLPESVDAVITFEYSAAHPENITRELVHIDDIESSFYRYNRGSGHLRIWKKDGSQARSLDDFIDNGETLNVADFESELTLYIEAINGSSIMTTITAHLMFDGVTVGSTTVEVLPFDSTTGLSVDKIEGYTIHYGSTTGTPGNDIIIGTGGDDVLIGGAGNDIIVSGGGDNLIDPGPGRNYIFASRGNNEIGPISSAATERGYGASNEPVLRDGDDNDIILDEDDKPFTTEQVLRAYRLIYGEDDPWLDIFLNVEIGDHFGIGWVESVERIGILFQSDARISRRYDHDQGRNVRIIQLSFSLQTPFIAATHLREKIIDLAGKPFVAPNFQGALIDHAFQKALAQDDFDEEINNFAQLRQQAFNNAAQATSLVSNIYIASIGIFNQGADVVLGMHELSEGNLTGALACLPFISAPAIGGAKTVVKNLKNGSILFTRIGRVIKGQESGLGVIYRKGMHIEAKQVNGKPAALMGSPQNTTGLPGNPHAAIVDNLARQRYDSGLAEFTVMNRSLRTSTGLDTLGAQANMRADIVVVRRNGKVDLYEVMSPSNTQEELINKLNDMRGALSPSNQGGIFLYDVNGLPIPIPGEPYP